MYNFPPDVAAILKVLLSEHLGAPISSKNHSFWVQDSMWRFLCAAASLKAHGEAATTTIPEDIKADTSFGDNWNQGD